MQPAHPTVVDNTGYAKVKYSNSLSKKHGKSCYRIYINNNQIIHQDKKKKFTIFSEPYLIEFKINEYLFEITRIDKNGITLFHVNPRDNIANIKNKLEFMDLKEEIPKLPVTFKKWDVLYNKNGVGVYGFELGRYILYFAKPTDDQFKKIKFNSTSPDNSTLKSEDGSLRFTCQSDIQNKTQYILNEEIAYVVNNTSIS